MKKSSFIALILGTVSGVLFALGMCMALLPEWNAFGTGVAFGCGGLALGMATFFLWCRLENKSMFRPNKKNILQAAYIVLAVLMLGLGLCMCMVWRQLVWGTITGLIGIIMLLGLIPMFKGIK